MRCTVPGSNTKGDGSRRSPIQAPALASTGWMYIRLRQLLIDLACPLFAYSNRVRLRMPTPETLNIAAQTVLHSVAYTC